jgi:hypothetical protein
MSDTFRNRPAHYAHPLHWEFPTLAAALDAAVWMSEFFRVRIWVERDGVTEGSLFIHHGDGTAYRHEED